MEIRKMEKLFGNIVREADRIAGGKWEKIYIIALCLNEKIYGECIYKNQNKKTGIKEATVTIKDYLKKYRDEVIKTEGKGWSEMVIEVGSSGHLNFDFNFEEITEEYDERIKNYRTKYGC